MSERILVVDDDVETLRLVGIMLQRSGYEILAASSGAQALTVAENGKPDLILLDIMMPDIDGIDVMRRLRTSTGTKDLPVILFTAKTQVDDKVIGFEAGADDYLTKPIEPRELVARVKAVLTRSSRVKPSPGQAARRGYAIGVMSARGGLGVSTLAINLGIALSHQEKQGVIVAEFRPGQAIMSLDLGIQHGGALNGLLQRNSTEIDARLVESALYSYSSSVHLLLASPQPRDAQYLSALTNFEAITQHLLQLASFVVFDLGPSISPVADKVLNYLDEMIVVTESTSQTIQQTRALLEDLAFKGIRADCIDVVLVNRERSVLQLTWGQVQEQLGRPVSVNFTPAPDLVLEATTKKMPVMVLQPDSLTAQQFMKLAEKVSKSKPR
jgi:CheY-like chemotaxis protein/MinD-like ATPase involved in chromosome partitioning or flagellar assembly